MRHTRMSGVRSRSGPRQQARRSRAVCAAVLACACLAACAGRGAAQQAGSNSHETLTLVTNVAPLGLNPATVANGPQQWVVDLAYLPLVDVNKNGQLVPGIAKSWTVGAGNTSINFTLDSKARFSDGTAVTATAVANSINYFSKTATGPSSQLFKAFKATAASGGHVIVTSSSPNPDLPLAFTPDFLGGDIISPAGLANPKKLQMDTAGAGPYMLDPSETTINSTYTYVPNPHYGEGKALYKKVIVKVITSQDSALQALKSGQVNVMMGAPQTVSEAKAAGLTVAYGVQAWDGLLLADHYGKVAPALKDIRVREALNYAINRASLTKAVVGQYGEVDEQPNSSGYQGYEPSLNSTYTYNVAKAKSLLRAAGYPNGFTMNVAFVGTDPIETETLEAMAAQLANIGVKLQLQADNTSEAFVKDIYSDKYSAIGLSFGGQPLFTLLPLFYEPGSPMNPFKVSYPSIVSAYQAYASAPADDVSTEAAAVANQIMSEVPAVSVLQSPQFIYASPWVKNVGIYAGGLTTNPRLWTTS